MIPEPPVGAEPAPPRPDLTFEPSLPDAVHRSGPRGLPAVTWGLGGAIVVWIVGNVFVGAIVVAGIVFAVAGVGTDGDLSGGLEIAATLLADAAFVGTIVVWLSRWHSGWLAALGILPRGKWLRQLAWGAVAGLILYLVITLVVGLALTLLFQLFSDRDVTTPDQIPTDLTIAGQIWAVILAVVVAPITEELFYRGVLFRSVRDRHGFWPGAIVSSLVFGVVHFVPAPWQDFVLLQSIMVFTGLGLAWIYERRGTIVAPIAAHMMFNVIGITLILGTG